MGTDIRIYLFYYPPMSKRKGQFTITLLGNNSGRNLGDAAILSSILEEISGDIPGTKFYVPSINPNWITKNYGSKYDVEAVNVMPWTGSIRLLGIPTIRCFAKSDAALICDGILFGKKLFNPAFNYLITLFFLYPFAKLLKCKLVCFNCGIGPFRSRLSRFMAKKVINACDMITMRENDSLQLAEEIGVTKPIELADLGINLETTRVIGVNVTKYLDTWLAPAERKEQKLDLITEIAEGLNKAKENIEAEDPERKIAYIVFCTQPMDLKICKKLASLIQAKVLDNSELLSHDIQAAMRECKLFIGMRFHSLILASSVGVPIVGLNYAPKVTGYMKLLNCEELGIELSKLNREKVTQNVSAAFSHRHYIKSQQQQIINNLRSGAGYATKLLAECLGIWSSRTL